MMNTMRKNPLHACAALLLASLAGAAGAQEAAASAPAAGEPAVIRFQRSAAYLDETAVADNIRKECSSLGSQLSASTERYAQEFGLKVERVESVEAKQGGTVLQLKIVSAISSGNAFIGHRKSVAVKAELFRDGQLVSQTTRSRDSMGGFAAGFKGSCDVLERTVNTLGSDIAKWLRAQG